MQVRMRAVEKQARFWILINERAGVYLTYAELMMNDLRTGRPGDLRLSINESRSRNHSSSMQWRPCRFINPKGWQKVAGGRNGAKTPGSSFGISRILKGCQKSATPPRSMGALRRRAGGVAALDHRLLSGKPLACFPNSPGTNQSPEPTAGHHSVFDGAQRFSAAGLRRYPVSGACGSATRSALDCSSMDMITSRL